MTTVLVTGAHRGIGLATSLELARRGHKVVASIRNLEDGDEVTEAAIADGVELFVEGLDLRQFQSFSPLVADLERRHGPIGAVVNNGGIEPVLPFVNVTPDRLRDAFDVNVIGPMLLTREFVARMTERGSGRVVTLSSLVRHPPLVAALMSVYGATKSAIDTWAMHLNVEVARFGVLSVIVELGGFDTAMMDVASFDVDELASESSPFRLFANEHIEGLTLLQGKLPGPEVAAVAIADVVEAESPALRTIVPDMFEEQVRLADALTDQEFLSLCLSESYRDRMRRSRAAFGAAAERLAERDRRAEGR